MARSIVVVACLLAMLSTLAFVPVSNAQETGLQLVTESIVPGSNDVKFPHVAAGRGQVHASGTVNEEDVNLWSKAEVASEFGPAFNLGEVDGSKPDWLVTSSTVDSEGALVVAWTHEREDRIYMRRRDPSGNWGPRRLVAVGDFPVFVETAVTSDGTIFVAWLEPNRSARFRYSTNQGVDWSATNTLGDVTAISTQFDLSSGPNGQVGVAWTAATSDLLQIYVGLWNGTSFNIQRVTRLDGNYANPTVTFAPNGTPYVAWRRDDGDGGIYYSERQPDGSWPASKLASGKANGRVNIIVDNQGNLHLNWISLQGQYRPFYAFKPAGQPFRGPIASASGGAIYHSDAAVSTDVQLLMHTVYEVFSGSRVYTRYSLFRAEGTIFSAEPVVENDAPVVGGKSTASVNFRNIRGGTPNQVRWRWGGEPSDTANDSGGWAAFSNPLSVPIPTSILEDVSCQPVTLYTQVRDSVSGLVEDRAKQDSILVDGVVEAESRVSNPFLYIGESPAALAGLDSVAGAIGGDPRHTRIPLMYLEVVSDGDCTDLKSVGIGRSADAIETAIAISNQGYRGFVPLPGIATLKDGPVPVVLQITDGAGNRRNFNTTIVFDETAPVLAATNPGTITAKADPSGDLLQDLTFENIRVTDEQYGGRGFWGVWLAVSRTPVADPASADLKWFAVPAPGTSNSFKVEDFSLASGLPANQVGPGTYYVYARFLDGAGNASEGALSVSINSQANRPKLGLPFLSK